MKIFFLENLDFVFLCYGAAFFLLGGACLVFYLRERNGGLPWLMLALFGFFHGAGEWLEMMSVSLMSARFLEGGRTLVLGFSFVFLLEFFRNSLARLKRINIAVLYLLPLVAVFVFWGQRGCWSCFNASLRYLVGLPAALGTAYVFMIDAGKEDQKRGGGGRLFLGLAFLFAVYAAAVGLVVARPHIPVVSVFRQEWFFEKTGLPIQFVRGVLATCIALGLLYGATKTIFIEGAKHGYGRAGLRFILVSFLGFYAFCLFSGYALARAVGDHERRHLDRIVLADARLLGAALGTVDVGTFEAARDGALYPKYRALHERLSELSDIATFIKALYLVALKDGRPSFVVGSQAQIFSMDVAPSLGADVPERIMRDALHSKKPTIFARRGRAGHEARMFFSVFVPLLSEKGEARSLLGMELDGTKIQRQIYKMRMFAFFVVGAFLILLVAGTTSLIIFVFKNIELQAQKTELNKALTNLREKEAELSKSEETFRSILNNSPNAIFGFDRDFRLVFWNIGAEKIYGYARSELINDRNPILSKKITEILGDDVAVRLEEVFAGITRHEEAAQKGRGGPLLVAMTLFPVKDRQGRILFGMGLAQDITLCKKT